MDCLSQHDDRLRERYIQQQYSEEEELCSGLDIALELDADSISYSGVYSDTEEYVERG
jgi:hypothetical protein